VIEGRPVATVDARTAAAHRLQDAAWGWFCHDETRPLKALAYRELARAAEAAGRELAPGYGKSQGVLAWHSSAGQLCWVVLMCYSRRSFRLSTAHTWFHHGSPYPRAPWRFELSFAPAEIAQVAKGFVRFTETAFASGGASEKIWRWPLFHGWGTTHWRVDYAWTRVGGERERLADVLRDGARG
jgi:hypothetical protein